MGLLDKLTQGAERVAREAEKAFEQGRTKIDELQLERQMDLAARKLGYLEFDLFRGRSVDEGARAALLSELARLEEQIAHLREERASARTGLGAQAGYDAGPAQATSVGDAEASVAGGAEPTPGPEDTHNEGHA